MYKDYLKDDYKAARQEAYDTGVLDKIKHNTGVYTPKMLRALRDMAKNNVYPDGTFGDEECAIWEMFRS